MTRRKWCNSRTGAECTLGYMSTGSAEVCRLQAVRAEIDRASVPCTDNEHRTIMQRRAHHDKAVPDGILKPQPLPDMEDHAQRIDHATGCDQPEDRWRQR